MAKTDNEVVTVNEGATYEANNGGKRVVVFFVDRPRSTVHFAPLNSSTEDSASIEDFLRDYKLIANQGEPLPEQK